MSKIMALVQINKENPYLSIVRLHALETLYMIIGYDFGAYQFFNTPIQRVSEPKRDQEDRLEI